MDERFDDSEEDIMGCLDLENAQRPHLAKQQITLELPIWMLELLDKEVMLRFMQVVARLTEFKNLLFISNQRQNKGVIKALTFYQKQSSLTQIFVVKLYEIYPSFFF